MTGTKDISEIIFNKILNKKEEIRHLFESSKNQIGYFFIDDVLPIGLALECFNVFSKKIRNAMLKKYSRI